MSKISRIRILNLRYNNDTTKIDDEIFDFGGENTLISLQNGGGKSVLTQMIISQFVNKSFRDFEDRKFKNYFNTNRPTFIMTEWQLDNNIDRFLSGMMIRKSQKEDNDTEELEIYTFTGSYSKSCNYDIDNIPIVKYEKNKKVLKNFGECKSLFENISKDKKGDFKLYDMGNRYARNQYYSTLRQYQINNKEWESIIRKVNQKESGLSELFNNAKDEKSLVENWFLRPIEDKLNKDKNKIDEFRTLTLKFIEQYRKNQSNIERKVIIEKYFEDTKKLKEDIEQYVSINKDKHEQTAKIVGYTKKLSETLDKISNILEDKKQSLLEKESDIKHIIYEQISYMIYKYSDEKDKVVLDKNEQEAEVIRLNKVIDSLSRQIDVCDCNKLFLELKDIKTEKSEVDEKIKVLLKNSKDNQEEVEKIGHTLYMYYTHKIDNNIKLSEDNAHELESTKKLENEIINNRQKCEDNIRSTIISIGKLENAVSYYDEIEDIFNKEFSCDLKRNIIGFYEDSIFDIKNKEMQEERQKENDNIIRLSKRNSELEIKNNILNDEQNQNNENIINIKHSINLLSEKLIQLEKQKEYRLTVIKYLNLKKSDIDNTNIIIDSIDRKIHKIDADKSSLITQMDKLNKQYIKLKEGKTIELPDNIKDYCEQNDINFIYGMEWLNKNGRTVEDNKKLIKNNPFIPYSIIMEKNTFENFRSNDEQLYTSFPIPIIIKDELEKTVDNLKNNVITYDNINFFIMFNNHYLDKNELENILLDIQSKITKLDKQIADKTSDIEILNKYKIDINNQTFSTLLYEKIDIEIKEYNQEIEKLNKIQKEIESERDITKKEYKENNKFIEISKDNIKQYDIKEREFLKLREKYKMYENDIYSLSHMKEQLQNLEKKQKSIVNKLEEISSTLSNLNAKKSKLEQITYNLNIKKEKYNVYSNSYYTNINEVLINIIPEQLEARFNAITKEVSDTMEELTIRQKRLLDKIDSKEKDLKKRNKRNISEAEYKSIIFSEQQYEEFESQKEKATVALNVANKKYNKLIESISAIDKDLQYGLRDLKDKTGYNEPIQREAITDTEFNKRISAKKQEVDIIKKEISKFDNKKNDLSAKLSGVSEYIDNNIEVSEERYIEIISDIPDLEDMDKAVLEQYQRNIKTNLLQLKDKLNEQQNYIAEEIRSIANKSDYKNDYFRKSFVNLLAQLSSPDSLLQQYDINKATYENQLEKLKIDLANIDSEQKNIEEMFLEYIKNVNDNIALIDKNSTINVRNKNIKMLKIQVPEWEGQKEYYKMQLHEYFERIINTGLDNVEKNKNLNETLGKLISTRNLYDNVIGINSIKIKLYKIEAEREVLISWSEVATNSGGEGFLSAFVILTCLLSYMRRDDSDLFTTGEEGKVLIMDNPFAQTYSEHLLKPLMEMAKKTNTQLICLSGLGGNSIYNRFDNIYVLKLIDSNIRNGVKRIESEHIKGNDVSRMVLSDFKTEQMSMFDMVE